MRDSNYDKCSMSYAFDRKTPNTHKIHLLPRKMSSIVLFTIHFLIHSFKILMKSWQTLVNSGLNRSTNLTRATRYKLIDVWCIQIQRKKLWILLCKVLRKPLLNLSFSYLRKPCSSAVVRWKKGKKNSTETSLQLPFCSLFKKLVGIEIGFQIPQSRIQAWFYRKFTRENRRTRPNKVEMSEVLSAWKKQKHKILYT